MLAENLVPAGHYDLVKIIFDQNQPGQDPRNYLRDKTDTTDGEVHTVNYVDAVADGFIIPASIDVAVGGNARLGLTMDLRSLFGMIDGTYTYKPVVSAVDLNQAGNIELNLAANDGTILVSAQRKRKIIRSMYAPATGGKILLTQLPESNNLGETYQVVLSSNSTDLKVIIKVPVKGGGQTTSIETSTPIVLVQGIKNDLGIQPHKYATSEVMGTMGAEMIINVKLNASYTLPVVASYALSSVSRLVPDSDPDYLQRYITFYCPVALAQVADFSAPSIEFQDYDFNNIYSEFVIDPDLNSSFIY